MDYFTMQMLALDIPSHRIDIAFCANNGPGNDFSSPDRCPWFRKRTRPEMSVKFIKFRAFTRLRSNNDSHSIAADGSTSENLTAVFGIDRCAGGCAGVHPSVNPAFATGSGLQETMPRQGETGKFILRHRLLLP